LAIPWECFCLCFGTPGAIMFIVATGTHTTISCSLCRQYGPVFSISSLMSMVWKVCWQLSDSWYKHQLIQLFVWRDGCTIDFCMSMLSPKAWTQLARNFELAGRTKNSLSVCVCLSHSLFFS
jgi:hypothetical protein